MNYTEIIVELIRADAKVLMDELHRQGKELTVSDYYEYDKLFSKANISDMVCWVDSLDIYLNGEEFLNE